jgi:hypothetical protein
MRGRDMNNELCPDDWRTIVDAVLEAIEDLNYEIVGRGRA